MNSEDGGLRTSLTAIYTPFTVELLKAKANNRFMESLISNVTCLFHAIYAFH